MTAEWLSKIRPVGVDFNQFDRNISRYERLLMLFRTAYSLLKTQEKTDPNFPKEKKQWLENYERTAMLLKRSRERLEEIKKQYNRATNEQLAKLKEQRNQPTSEQFAEFKEQYAKDMDDIKKLLTVANGQTNSGLHSKWAEILSNGSYLENNKKDKQSHAPENICKYLIGLNYLDSDNKTVLTKLENITSAIIGNEDFGGVELGFNQVSTWFYYKDKHGNMRRYADSTIRNAINKAKAKPKRIRRRPIISGT
ncbi:hypothetical protein NO2_0612 [Candidatus Termititenax persephonae]|uniref:Uncharacterized protein n=1 Tax=Candidatus Termititenax persephonae TaxID=2218525 RepID=A0A388TH36_9BACT|nr:hypothetical protein NO2_0612 [Candidatus Termititenax persephonae]